MDNLRTRVPARFKSDISDWFVANLFIFEMEASGVKCGCVNNKFSRSTYETLIFASYPL